MKNLDNFFPLASYGVSYGKNSKKPQSRCKSFGYQVLGFGSGVADAAVLPTQIAAFAFGRHEPGFTYVSTKNMVNTSGVVASDASTAATAKRHATGGTYGEDKAIFAFGSQETGGGPNYVSYSNLVSNTGTFGSDVTGVGTARAEARGLEYGGDKVIIAFGYTDPSYANVNTINLVSNAGVVASDSTGNGTARSGPGSTGYGEDLGIFAYGGAGGVVSMSNLVSNTGVVANDVTGVGTARAGCKAARYGADTALFFGGNAPGSPNMTNLVTNLGVIGSDVSGVYQNRTDYATTRYGGDKAIIGFGYADVGISGVTNLVNNSGVVQSDTDAVGTARYSVDANGFGN